MAPVHSVAGEIDLHRGNVEQAQASLERAAEAAGRTSDILIRALLVDRPALLAVVRGDPDRAAALVDEEIAKSGDGERVGFTSRMYAVALRAHADRAERARALGDLRTVRDAERAGTALVERFERLMEPNRWLDPPPPGSVAHAALASAELERLRGAAVRETWSAVAARWTELGFMLELAYVRWRQAEAVLGAGGTRAEASEPLREAARLTAGCGASLLAGEIEALSRRARIALGVGVEGDLTEPPGPAVERFGLTDRELDVLALIVEGRTNREIGEALFISTKTASAHVSHILSKLEVRSRIEAATAAHRLGLVPTPSSAQTEPGAIPGHMG
jgi:DNA-binding CsgD family transcriptional regulator